jgi:O-antigen ligase
MEVTRTPRSAIWIVTGIVVSVTVVLKIATSAKVSFYLDALERSNLIYAAPLAAVIGLFLVLAYPKAPLYGLAFLLPFNFVGGFWGSDIVVLLAKLGMNVLVAAALIPTFLAPASHRAWLRNTHMGIASMAWLVAIAMGIVLGLLAGTNREYWVRESGWMLFSVAVLPFGTLLRTRRDIERIVWWTCAGVAVLQAYAFWTLMTGTRYTRTDVYEGVQSFFRAPYSCVSLFVLYLAAAALLFGSHAQRLTGRTRLLLVGTVALLGGGLLASMVRSLWISGAFGMLVVFYLAPWDRRTAKMALTLCAGAVLAVAVVAAIDRLSPESSGDWTGRAFTFLKDLGSSQSTSRVTREIEWGHAIDVWTDSPIVGLGFGYAFPQTDFGQIPEEVRPEPFYMHNSYLNVLAKIGMFGLAAFVYLLVRTAVAAHAIVRRRGAAAEDQVLGTAILAALAAVALATSTTSVLTTGDQAAYLGLLVGLTVSVRHAQLNAAG